MKSAHPPLSIQIGQVFVSWQICRHRRVLYLYEDQVLYSDGGNHNRWCKQETFRRWVKQRQAEQVI